MTGRAREMAKRGRKYREDYEFELYGEPVKLSLRPLVDDEFLPLAAFLAEHFDIDDEEIRGEDVVDEARDEIDDARDDAGDIDVSQLDEEFVEVMQSAAVLGVMADYDEDGEKVAFESNEETRDFIESLMGGYSIELGGEVLDLSGNIREAKNL